MLSVFLVQSLNEKELYEASSRLAAVHVGHASTLKCPAPGSTACF